VASRGKHERRPETIVGRYVPIPHSVMDSAAFRAASFPARALLLELGYQHNGCNNGHLQLCASWLAKRGFSRSSDVLHRAKAHLIELQLIVETRKGGLNYGPSLYALTWHAITDFRGLDIQHGEYRKGAYALMNAVPKINTAAPPHGASCSALRSETAPPNGAAIARTDPPRGAKTPVFEASAAPSDGDNLTIAIPRGGSREAKKRRVLLVAEALEAE
jgi:hypothetical protein